MVCEKPARFLLAVFVGLLLGNHFAVWVVLPALPRRARVQGVAPQPEIVDTI